MSMDAELISKYITQQVTAAMTKKKKLYEKKLKKLEKVGKDGVSGESEKNRTRGGGRASKKNKKSTTQTTTKSKTPKQSASRSAQGLKIIFWSPSRRRNREAGNADSGTPGNGKGKKDVRLKSASRSTKQTSKIDGAKSRGRSKKN